MTMQEDNIDKIFREKTDNLSQIPSQIKWNKSEGWRNFQKEHSYLSIINHKILLAASIAFFIIIIVSIFYIKHNNAYELFTYEGNKDVVKEINLKGGHKCFLAEGSKIQYQNLKFADTLFLDGEGYFETSAIKPLVIIAKNTITKCLNSKVDIKAVKHTKTTIINSLSGNITSCCIENDFPEMKIEPDERCIIYEGGIYAVKEPNTDPNFLAWKTGYLSFNNIPLACAIKTLEEIYNVKIEVQSEEVKYCRLSNEFENTSFENVLEYIQCHFDAIVNRSKNSITLEGGICKK